MDMHQKLGDSLRLVIWFASGAFNLHSTKTNQKITNYYNGVVLGCFGISFLKVSLVVSFDLLQTFLCKRDDLIARLNGRQPPSAVDVSSTLESKSCSILHLKILRGNWERGHLFIFYVLARGRGGALFYISCQMILKLYEHQHLIIHYRTCAHSKWTITITMFNWNCQKKKLFGY